MPYRVDYADKFDVFHRHYNQRGPAEAYARTKSRKSQGISQIVKLKDSKPLGKKTFENGKMVQVDAGYFY